MPEHITPAVVDLIAAAGKRIDLGRRRINLYNRDERLIYELVLALSEALGTGSRVPEQLSAKAKAEIWDDAYRQGVDDEAISNDNIGIAGLGGKITPARTNPYRALVGHGTPEPTPQFRPNSLNEPDGHWTSNPAPEPTGENEHG